jgi:hypothetical protein
MSIAFIAMAASQLLGSNGYDNEASFWEYDAGVSAIIVKDQAKEKG